MSLQSRNGCRRIGADAVDVVAVAVAVTAADDDDAVGVVANVEARHAFAQRQNVVTVGLVLALHRQIFA